MRGRLTTLCRLQWILAWRQSRGTPYERLFFLAFLVPSILAACAGMGFAMFRICRRVAVESPYHTGLFLMGLGGGLTVCYLISLALERNSTMGVDFSRLLHFPLPPGEVVASQVFGYCVNPLFMGFPAVLFLGCTVGIFASGRHLLALCALAGSALWVVQLSLVLTVGELVRLRVRATPKLARAALMGIILTGVGGLVIWVSLWGTASEGTYFGGAATLMKQIWLGGRDLIVLLPGVSPLSWVGGGGRNAGALPAAILEISVLAWASSRLVRQLAREGAAAFPVRGRAGGAGGRLPSPYPWEGLSWWPHFQKELRCTLRDRTQVISVVCLCFASFLLPRLAEELGFLGEAVSQVVIPFALAGLLSMGTLNQFGLEAISLPMVLSTPVPRWRVLLGKNLSGILLLLFLLVGQESVRCLHGAGAGDVAADLLFAVGTLAILSGLGNYFSILFPYPAAVPGKNLFPQVSQARLMVISLFQLVFMCLAGAALTPLLAGRWAMVQFAGSPTVMSLAAVAMALYATGLYSLLLAGAGRVLLRMEAHLFVKLQKSNG